MSVRTTAGQIGEVPHSCHGLRQSAPQPQRRSARSRTPVFPMRSPQPPLACRSRHMSRSDRVPLVIACSLRRLNAVQESGLLRCPVPVVDRSRVRILGSHSAAPIMEHRSIRADMFLSSNASVFRGD